MLKALRISPALLCLLLWGCASPSSREGEVILFDTALPVSFEVIGAGATAALDTSLEVAVRDVQAWDTLQRRLTFHRPARAVDLDGAMLLVAAVETARSGHALRFDTVEEDSAGVVATYTVFTPGADCFTDATPQHPFQVVRLRSVPGVVRFVRQDEALPCTAERW